MSLPNIYDASFYGRISHEDASGIESNSIANQMSYMEEYVKGHPELRIVSRHKDDGYSGVNFMRPGFQTMLEDIKKGNINCVIVKDLSRFGRNHIEVAEYLEHVFPFLGVRFIAINDNYDSARPSGEADHIVIPFKNLVNESYLRDISIKVRSSLATKRNRGQFVANFAPYGYERSSESRHQLAIDPYAACVVQRIFAMKLVGCSHASIAETLNSEGELVPLDYKNISGIKQYSPLKKSAVTRWSYTTVDGILKNSVYTGTLSQGKTTTPSYKVKKIVEKPRNEWAITPDAHPAIISKSDFEIMSNLLRADTRTPPGSGEVFVFSGMVYCYDCRSPMIRKTIPSKGKKYTYYVCSANKKEKTCSSHSIKEEKLTEAVFQSIMRQVMVAIDMREWLRQVRNTPHLEKLAASSNEQLQLREHELEEVNEMRRGLYEDHRAGILSKEDFILFNRQYANKAEILKSSISQLKSDIEHLLCKPDAIDWLEQFASFAAETQLNRKILVTLVERIYVGENKTILVNSYFQDKMQLLLSMSAGGMGKTSEVQDG